MPSSSSRSKRLRDVESRQLQSTGSSYVHEATSRRRIYAPGTRSCSRKNRACDRCGGPTPGRGRHCHLCYEEMRKSDVKLRCDQCGATFERKACSVQKALKRGSTAAYCSRVCVHAATKVNRLCVTCSEPTGRKTRRYCDACRPKKGAGRSLIPKTCPQCSKTFEPRTSRHTYCGRDCANEAHSIRMRGEGNSHFKRGDSYSKLVYLIKPLILERDSGRCVVCSTDRRLVMHHIDENPKHNDPTNLIILCRPCHSRHHKSASTPFPWFAHYALGVSWSMTSRWRERATSLLKEYSSTTA